MSNLPEANSGLIPSSFQARFNSAQPRNGVIKEWSLVMHGTKEPPYSGLAAGSPHSKLAIVKKAHEERKM